MDKISIIILTYNEEENIVACLDSLQGIEAFIFVFDSYSTDETISILEQRNISYLQHPFTNYSQQRNKAQELCPFPSD